MPITHLHAITQTLSSAIEYCSNDKIEDYEKNDIQDSLSYARNDKTGEVIYHTITTTLNCPNGDRNVEKDFEEVIKKYNDTEYSKRKRNENQRNPLAWHLVQSFDGYVPPLLANQIGREFAEEFLGSKFRIQISTHTNTENIHNHIIFCAWDIDGKKYHDCHESTNRMREISDRLAEKYGLEVLEGTRFMNLIKWVGEDGKTHYYEPTNRKNKIIEQRKESEIKDDVSSYRFSDSYDSYVNKKMSLRDTVKNDIEMMLPIAVSYEHLLALLKENLGYEINDRKKDGQWKEHISFKPVGFDKAVRDSSLDPAGFYEREKISKRIQELKNTSLQQKDDNNRADKCRYQYGMYDVKKMSEEHYYDYRMKTNYSRGPVQKKTVKEIKSLDQKLCDALNSVGYNGKEIDDIIRQYRRGRYKKPYKIPNETYLQKNIFEIQNRLEAIWFMEQSGIQTAEQLKSVVDKYLEKYEKSYELYRRAEETIKKIDGLVEVPERLKAVQDRINKLQNDEGYSQAELKYDLSLRDKYVETIHKYNLDENEIGKLKEKIEAAKRIYKELQKNMDNCTEQIQWIKDCVKTIYDIESSDDFEMVRKDIEEKFRKQEQKEKTRVNENKNERNGR